MQRSFSLINNKRIRPFTNSEIVWAFFYPVILNTLESSINYDCSHRSAWPNLSALIWSIWAMGMHQVVLRINSTSSLSISWTTIIPFLARKWRERSLVAFLKILFWIKRTLNPDATIFWPYQQLFSFIFS